MRRFSFSLKDLLGLREFREREAQMELAAKTGKVNLLEQELKRIAGERLRTYAERGAGARGIGELIDSERYLARLESEKERTLRDLAAAEIERQKALAVYQEALKQKKVLERLRDSELEAYKKERERQEGIVLDDIITGARSRLALSGLQPGER
jgi:flagellar protein FliJ